MSEQGKEYWKWFKYWYDQRGMDFAKIRPVDCLVGEIATPKLHGYGWLNYKEDYENEFRTMEMNDFFEFLTKDLSFNVDYVNNHINWWTFEKLTVFLKNAGFSNILCSKYGASYCYEMQNRKYFDRTHPEMSIYVDAIK